MEFTTAHDLAADWSWMDQASGFSIGRSSVVWEQAQYGRGSRVRISRLVIAGDSIQQHDRYVNPDAQITLR